MIIICILNDNEQKEKGNCLMERRRIMTHMTRLLIILITGYAALHAAASTANAQELDRLQELEKRIKGLEKKTDDMATRQIHTDKHILHMEETIPKTIDGLSIAGGITMIVQGTSGNGQNNPDGGDVIDGSFSLDLEVAAVMGENGTVFILVETGSGNGVQDEIVSFWGVNNDAVVLDSTLEVTEAWYEHTFFGDRLNITVGKLDLTNYFDGNEVANNEKEQFLASGFVNNIAVEFPFNGPGSRITYSPVNFLDISLGWQQGDAFYEDLNEEPFFITEAGFKPDFTGYPGNYRLYCWINYTDHVKLSDPENDEEPGWGIGISFDQTITDTLTWFGRAGYQDKEIYAVETALSTGGELKGSLWGRKADTLGFAAGVALLSSDYEDVLEAMGIDPRDEWHYEVYYRIAVNEHLTVSPDVQVVTNALGDNDFGTVVVAGLRGQFTF